jgi:hypothetical protein
MDYIDSMPSDLFFVILLFLSSVLMVTHDRPC